MVYEKDNTLMPQDYGNFLQAIKQRVQESRLRAYRSVIKN